MQRRVHQERGPVCELRLAGREVLEWRDDGVPGLHGRPDEFGVHPAVGCGWWFPGDEQYVPLVSGVFFAWFFSMAVTYGFGGGAGRAMLVSRGTRWTLCVWRARPGRTSAWVLRRV